MILFKVLLGIDALASLVVIYFFFVGLADGSVSSFNKRIWAVLLAVVAAVPLGSLWLSSYHLRALAILLQLVLAVPAILYLSYFVLAFCWKGRWN